jgi:hypothetical protein
VGLFEDLWGEAEMVVVVVGCHEREIAQGQGFCPANRKLSAMHSVLVWYGGHWRGAF